MHITIVVSVSYSKTKTIYSKKIFEISAIDLLIRNYVKFIDLWTIKIELRKMFKIKILKDFAALMGKFENFLAYDLIIDYLVLFAKTAI